MKILIIEDDLMIRKELTKLLLANNYEVVNVDDFNNLFEKISRIRCELILLDVNLPFENGFEVCRRIRKVSKVPIIFVTSRSSDEDELRSILVGGNDLVKKPYNKLILLEKIRRVKTLSNPDNNREITINGVTLDVHLSILKHDGKQVELTRNEYRILYYFFNNPNRVIKKEELLEYLWNDKYYLDENILTVNINRLRNKAKEIGVPNLIKTIRKEGYTLWNFGAI